MRECKKTGNQFPGFRFEEFISTRHYMRAVLDYSPFGKALFPA